MNHATITNHRNGRVTIAGLTHGDCRLISRAIAEGAHLGGDRGGEVSKALLRFSHIIHIPASFPSLHTPVKFVAGDSVPRHLYEETENLR